MLEKTVPWDVEPHCWDDIADDAMRTIYKAYARPLGIGARPAVLAIDLYKMAFAGRPVPPEQQQDEYPSSCGIYAHNAIGPISELFSTARRLEVPVVHVTGGKLRYSGSTNRRTVDGADDGWEFQPECAPLPGEVIVEKYRASGFYGTTLVSELVRRQIDTLIVVGESTSGCMRATTVDGYSNGFHMVVVEDGVFDRSWLNHCVNLFDLHHKYADVMTSRTVQGLLAGQPAAIG
jgi:nicotinamidase-related amidase